MRERERGGISESTEIYECVHEIEGAEVQYIVHCKCTQMYNSERGGR